MNYFAIYFAKTLCEMSHKQPSLIKHHPWKAMREFETYVSKNIIYRSCFFKNLNKVAKK